MTTKFPVGVEYSNPARSMRGDEAYSVAGVGMGNWLLHRFY